MLKKFFLSQLFDQMKMNLRMNFLSSIFFSLTFYQQFHLLKIGNQCLLENVFDRLLTKTLHVSLTLTLSLSFKTLVFYFVLVVKNHFLFLVSNIFVFFSYVFLGVVFEKAVEWGIDLGSEHERWLAETHFKRPTICYNYPKGKITLISFTLVFLAEDGERKRETRRTYFCQNSRPST